MRVCGAIALLCCLALPRGAEAKLVAVGTAAEQQQILDLLKKLCKDFPLMIAADGTVTKGGRLDTNSTPKGCQLICRLVGHMRTATVKLAPVLAGATDATDPMKRDDRNNGTGTDSTTEFDQNCTDTKYLIHTGFGKNNTPSPAHIILGHELIHSLHNLDGDRDAADKEGQTIDGKKANDITENDLLGEQMPPIPKRKGHCGALKC
jgi:Effector protein